MKTWILSACAAALLLIPEAARAGGESGIYIGASLGSAGLDISDGGVEYDDDDTAYKIFAGYNFGKLPFINLGVEGSYIDFGTAKGDVLGNRAETDVSGLDAFGLVGVNLGPASLFGKVGAIYWNSESSLGANDVDDSSTDAAFGVGLQFQVLSIGFRAEYELFKLDVADIGFVSAGVSYTF